MRRGPSLVMSEDQRRVLIDLSDVHGLSSRAARQATALLMAADGQPTAEIARTCRTTPETVRRWRRSFEASGVSVVGRIAPGRGRKPKLAPELIEQIVHDTMHTQPERGMAWSTRTMAERHGVSKDTVARIWRQRDLAPRENGRRP